MIGLNRLCAVHLNDSRNPRASHKDRHEKIGKGCIGKKALMAVVTHPLLQKRSFILETPNDDDGYKAEIAMVKEAEKNAAPPELTDRKIYDTPIGPVCMSKTEHEAYLEEVEIRKLREK